MDATPTDPMTDDALAKRLLDLSKRIPSLTWWFSPNPNLQGLSPRQAVDAGRIADVEALLGPL